MLEVDNPQQRGRSMPLVSVSSDHSTARSTASELNELLTSWRRHLVAQHLSPATLSTYSTSVGQLSAFLAAKGMPTAPSGIRREHVEAFITDLLERWKP